MYTPKGQKGILSDYIREPNPYYARYRKKAQQTCHNFHGAVGVFDVNSTVVVTWKDT